MEESFIDRTMAMATIQGRMAKMAHLFPFWAFLQKWHRPITQLAFLSHVSWTEEDVDYMNLLWKRELLNIAKKLF